MHTHVEILRIPQPQLNRSPCNWTNGGRKLIRFDSERSETSPAQRSASRYGSLKSPNVQLNLTGTWERFWNLQMISNTAYYVCINKSFEVIWKTLLPGHLPTLVLRRGTGTGTTTSCLMSKRPTATVPRSSRLFGVSKAERTATRTPMHSLDFKSTGSTGRFFCLGSFVGWRPSLLEAIASRLEAIASRLEAIASRLEAVASRLEAIALG